MALLPFPTDMPRDMMRRIFMLRIMKADAEQVEEVLIAGGDPNWCTKGGIPAMIRLVRNRTVMADVVTVLLKYGADPNRKDSDGFTALDHARRRVAKFEGKPRRTPPRSRSLTPGGELRLGEREWEFIDELEREHPGAGDQYLAERRKVAERVFDNRGNLEKIVEILEARAR